MTSPCWCVTLRDLGAGRCTCVLQAEEAKCFESEESSIDLWQLGTGTRPAPDYDVFGSQVGVFCVCVCAVRGQARSGHCLGYWHVTVLSALQWGYYGETTRDCRFPSIRREWVGVCVCVCGSPPVGSCVLGAAQSSVESCYHTECRIKVPRARPLRKLVFALVCPRLSGPNSSSCSSWASAPSVRCP